MLRFITGLLFLFIFKQGVAQNERWTLNTEKSVISYSANHLLHPWEGTNQNVKGILLIHPDEKEIKELAVLTLVRDFDSKNSGRDAHALEVLEALSFPEVRFYSNLTENKKDSILIHGKLDFHGVLKNHTIVAHQKKTPQGIVLKGSFKIKPTDFGIELPSFMMVKIDNLLSFKFELEFTK